MAARILHVYQILKGGETKFMYTLWIKNGVLRCTVPHVLKNAIRELGDGYSPNQVVDILKDRYNRSGYKEAVDVLHGEDRERLKKGLDELNVLLSKALGRAPHLNRKVHEARRHGAGERSIHSVDNKIEDTAAMIDKNSVATGITNAGRGRLVSKKANPSPTPTWKKEQAAKQGKMPIAPGKAPSSLFPSFSMDQKRQEDDSQLGGARDMPTRRDDLIQQKDDPDMYQANVNPGDVPDDEGNPENKQVKKTDSKFKQRLQREDIPTLIPTDPTTGKKLRPIEKVDDGEVGYRDDGNAAYRGPTTKTKRMEKIEKKKQEKEAKKQQEEAAAMGGQPGMPPGAPPGMDGGMPPSGEMGASAGAPPPGMAPGMPPGAPPPGMPPGAMPPGAMPPPGMGKSYTDKIIELNKAALGVIWNLEKRGR